MTSINTFPIVFSNTDDTFDTDTQEITSITTKRTLLDFRGLELKYDLTSTPKQFSISDGGINFRDGTNNYTTGLERLALVQTAFQAVELPPNATTLKINDTILLDAGVATQSTSITDGTMTLSNAGVGGLSNPQITLNNTNTSATLNDGVVNIEMYKSGRNAQTSETLGSISVYGNDGGSQKTEFARIQVKTENVASGNEDGTLSIYTSVNGVNSEVFNFNGAQNENNSFRPLDLNGNALRTTTGDMSITTASSSGNGDLTITAKRELQLLSAGDDITISTASSTGGGDIDITGKSGSITTITATAIALNSTGGGGINLNSSGLVGLVAGTTIDLTSTAGAITLTPSTSVVLSTQIQMPTTSGTISYSTITGFLSIDFASQSTGYFELGNLPAGSISGLTLTNGRIGGKYHILLRGQLGFNWSPSTSATFKANNYSLSTSSGSQWIGLDIYFANTLSQYLVNATFYS
jgi:hypothetical protein